MWEIPGISSQQFTVPASNCHADIKENVTLAYISIQFVYPKITAKSHTHTHTHTEVLPSAPGPCDTSAQSVCTWWPSCSARWRWRRRWPFCRGCCSRCRCSPSSSSPPRRCWCCPRCTRNKQTITHLIIWKRRWSLAFRRFFNTSAVDADVNILQSCCYFQVVWRLSGGQWIWQVKHNV